MTTWGLEAKNWGLNAPLCHTDFILACQATFLILSVIILQTIYSSKLFFSTRYPVRDPILSDPDFVDVLPFQSINEDHENEDLRPPTKTKSHHENEDTLLKQVQKRLVLLLWTKIMFMRHTTKTKILTEILNSEFGTSVVYYGIFQKKSPMEPSMELL